MSKSIQSSPVSASLSALDEIPDERSSEVIDHLLPSEASPIEDLETNLEELLLREERASRRALPWWKRPSPWWIIVLNPLLYQLPQVASAPPLIELINQVVCFALRPEYAAGSISARARTPDPKLCAADSEVQAAVAQLMTTLTMTMGILGCLTAAYWGSCSDRRGRLFTMKLGIVAILLDKVTCLLVFLLADRISGGFRLLLLAAAFQGLCGGIAAYLGAIFAYMSDCTEPDQRSRVFSIYLGASYAGVAVGPIVSSLIVRYSHNAINVFYFIVTASSLLTFFIFFVIPESVSPARMALAREKHAERNAGTRSGTLKMLFQWLSPLLVLGPKRVQLSSTSLKLKRDWNLTILGVAYGLVCIFDAVALYEFQYATAVFGWSAEELGYWLSVIGVSKTTFLTLILPTLIKLVQQRGTQQGSVQLPIEPDEPLEPELSSSVPPELSSKTEVVQQRSPSLDLGIARVSTLVDLVTYSLLTFIAGGPAFTFFTALASFGSGFGPALQSIALAVYTSRGEIESGALFGALSVIQGFSGQVLGPTMFGFTYAKTASRFPSALFLVCAVSAFVTFSILAFVRVPEADGKKGLGDEAKGTATEDIAQDYEETLVQL